MNVAIKVFMSTTADVLTSPLCPANEPLPATISPVHTADSLAFTLIADTRYSEMPQAGEQKLRTLRSREKTGILCLVSKMPFAFQINIIA
ncbi:hypothetical protein J6590_071727 [Homalodisca vitripennis]|nr:hypothetical protein J6590_071727 [Homalodisca vitripennis]